MNPRRCPGVFGGVALAIALGACTARPAATEPNYFEASAGDPPFAAADRARPTYADSIARYRAVVGAMHGSAAELAGPQALDDLADAVATLPDAANGTSAEAIRAHARELRGEANDPKAARHIIGLALAVAANAFDEAARVTYPDDAALARSVADLRTDVYPVVTDDTQADRADVYRALTGMDRVLRAYEHAAATGGG